MTSVKHIRHTFNQSYNVYAHYILVTHATGFRAGKILKRDYSDSSALKRLYSVYMYIVHPIPCDATSQNKCPLLYVDHDMNKRRRRGGSW